VHKNQRSCTILCRIKSKDQETKDQYRSKAPKIRELLAERENTKVAIPLVRNPVQVRKAVVGETVEKCNTLIVVLTEPDRLWIDDPHFPLDIEVLFRSREGPEGGIVRRRSEVELLDCDECLVAIPVATHVDEVCHHLDRARAVPRRMMRLHPFVDVIASSRLEHGDWRNVVVEDERKALLDPRDSLPSRLDERRIARGGHVLHELVDISFTVGRREGVNFFISQPSLLRLVGEDSKDRQTETHTTHDRGHILLRHCLSPNDMVCLSPSTVPGPRHSTTEHFSQPSL